MVRRRRRDCAALRHAEDSQPHGQQMRTENAHSARPDAAPPADADEHAAVAPTIRLVHLHKSFGRLSVLRGISLDFPTGQTTVVLGPSGCGKSVMLKHIIGLLKPDSGQVWFENQRVDTLNEA